MASAYMFGSGGAGAEAAAQVPGHRSNMACLLAHMPRLASSKQLADPVAFKSCACRRVISDVPGGGEAAPPAAAAQPMTSTDAQMSSWHGHSFGTVADVM